MMRRGSNVGSAATTVGDASLVDCLEIGADLLRGVEAGAVEGDRDVVVGRRPHVGHHGVDVELTDPDQLLCHLAIVLLPLPFTRSVRSLRRLTCCYVSSRMTTKADAGRRRLAQRHDV